MLTPAQMEHLRQWTFLDGHTTVRERARRAETAKGASKKGKRRHNRQPAAAAQRGNSADHTDADDGMTIRAPAAQGRQAPGSPAGNAAPAEAAGRHREAAGRDGRAHGGAAGRHSMPPAGTATAPQRHDCDVAFAVRTPARPAALPGRQHAIAARKPPSSAKGHKRRASQQHMQPSKRQHPAASATKTAVAVTVGEGTKSSSCHDPSSSQGRSSSIAHSKSAELIGGQQGHEFSSSMGRDCTGSAPIRQGSSALRWLARIASGL